MIYLWIKYIHILSATILFGTGIGTAAVMLYGHLSKNIQAMTIMYTYVVLVDWFFTGISGFMQITTGLLMVYLAGYSFTSLWIAGSVCGYCITAIAWFIVVYYQIKIKQITKDAARENQPLPPQYYYYFKKWVQLGILAFASLLIVFYLMVFRPG